jgi:hypothetical protein
MDANQLQAALIRLNACSDAVAWAEGKSLSVAWRTCQRGDWLLWLACRANVDRKLIVRATCDVAKTTLKYIPAGELRPAKAIDTALAWCAGQATLAEVRQSAAAAYAAAAYAAYAADAADAAAAAAADAADAAAAYAAYAADADAADAAAAYAAAAYAAYAADAARKKSLHKSAIIIRKHISAAMIAQSLGAS